MPQPQPQALPPRLPLSVFPPLPCRLSFDAFIRLLALVESKRRTPLEEVAAAVAGLARRGPSLAAGATTPDFVKWHDDRSTYTGAVLLLLLRVVLLLVYCCLRCLQPSCAKPLPSCQTALALIPTTTDAPPPPPPSAGVYARGMSVRDSVPDLRTLVDGDHADKVLRRASLAASRRAAATAPLSRSASGFALQQPDWSAAGSSGCSTPRGGAGAALTPRLALPLNPARQSGARGLQAVPSHGCGLLALGFAAAIPGRCRIVI